MTVCAMSFDETVAVSRRHCQEVDEQKEMNQIGADGVISFAGGKLDDVMEEDDHRQKFSNESLARNSPVLNILSRGEDKPVDGVLQPTKTRLVEVIPGRLCFLPTNSKAEIQEHSGNGNYRFMTSKIHLLYEAFCDDFGPIAISQVIRFCRAMSKVEQAKGPRRAVVYYCEASPRHCANTVFLIVVYLVLELGWRVEEAMAPFASLDSSMVEPFRDATWIQPPQHGLSVRRCVEGLLKGLQLGWLDRFDMARYDTMDDPLYGNVNELCPKFVACKGPVAAGDIAKGDLASFPPHYYAHVFKQLGVEAVVRLNEPGTYDAQPFVDAGMKHYDLFFEDCTVPSAEVIARFLDLCDAHSKVAVHCAAGLGRTGTLIALWLMRRHGFGADAAIGFLRIMRPGCVIGPQQCFLQLAEGAEWDHNRLLAPSTGAASDRHWHAAGPCHRTQSSASAPAGNLKPAGGVMNYDVRRTVSAVEAPSGTGKARGESLFGGLLRVQQAEQMASQVRDALKRRAVKASSSFRGAHDGVASSLTE